MAERAANQNQDYKVTFDWSTTGKCGVPPSGNNSGHCMILQPVEVQIGGKPPRWWYRLERTCVQAVRSDRCGLM